MKFAFIRFLLLLLPVISCKSGYYYANPTATLIPVQQDSLKRIDSAVYYLIAPYKAKLETRMNEVIGTTSTRLTKEKPECTLGNLVSDATLWYTKRHYDNPVDACVMNYGGIRIPSIEPGPIRVETIYELMPFDNLIEVLEIKGSVLRELLDLVAAAGGWPVSGITMQIEKGKAVNIVVGGKPLDEQQTYTLVTSDYVANGGDRADMLKSGDHKTVLHDLVRDAILDYVRYKKSLTLNTDGRIIHKP